MQAQRIPGGAMPARSNVVTELMKLQLRLMSANRAADAAICTAAIFQMEADGERIARMSS